jgi:hypothetical protein
MKIMIDMVNAEFFFDLMLQSWPINFRVFMNGKYFKIMHQFVF